MSTAVHRARATQDRLHLVDGLWVLGMVLCKQTRDDEAAAALEEGLELARCMPNPYAEARILEQLGKAQEALDIFRRLGARKDVERIERGLSAPSTA